MYAETESQNGSLAIAMVSLIGALATTCWMILV
jgi:hypothetical protein